ncbi:CoA pyrophosphatase [Chachezhania antarctica]|uniref:CoA pyrophosphatase n=1 Tax=Chachezhania antarctica TaxID=2340860 RepID=UPI000EB1CE95|nr:CoA pyrophosphatase [Chachezhania antarctica]
MAPPGRTTSGNASAAPRPVPQDPAALVDALRDAIARPGDDSTDFDLNPAAAAEVAKMRPKSLRPAGVLVAIDVTGATPQLILTKRSSHLAHHPGQIAFPGGKQEEADADVSAAALREAREEIGLPFELPEVLGVLPAHETVTGFHVTPVIALVREPFTITPEPGEVEEVFRVPFSHVMTPEKYIIESRLWRGVRRHYFTVPYGPYYIWGATARMLRGLAGRMEAVAAIACGEEPVEDIGKRARRGASVADG